MAMVVLGRAEMATLAAEPWRPAGPLAAAGGDDIARLAKWVFERNEFRAGQNF